MRFSIDHWAVACQLVADVHRGRTPRSVTIERVRALGIEDISGQGLIAAAVPATVGVPS
jgi:hypothetical protein